MRSRFAGGDPEYIRTTQYGTTDKLAARQRLHTHSATAPVRWFPWMVAQIAWQPGMVVEVGCGPGDLWDEGRPPIEGPLVLTDLSDGMVSAGVARASGSVDEVVGCVAAAQALPVADSAATHVISNHMLYHVPHPPDAVREMARIVADDGLVTVATNGRNHMAELKRINSTVFETNQVDHSVTAFGLESGRPMLESEFAQVELRRYSDELRATEAQVVVDYLTSYPPGEDATPDQLEELVAMVEAEFVAGEGVFSISKDVGLFLCRGPRRGE